MQVSLQKNKFAAFHEEAATIRQRRRDERRAEKTAKKLQEEQEKHYEYLKQISEGRVSSRPVSNWADLSDDDCFYDSKDVDAEGALKSSANGSEANEPDYTGSESSSDTSNEDDEDEEKPSQSQVSSNDKLNEIPAESTLNGGATKSCESNNRKNLKAKTAQMESLSKKERQQMKLDELEALHSIISELKLNYHEVEEKNTKAETPVVENGKSEEAAPAVALNEVKRKKKKAADKSSITPVAEAANAAEPIEEASTTGNTINREEALKRVTPKSSVKKKVSSIEGIKKQVAEEEKKKKNTKKPKKDKLLFSKSSK